MQRACLAEATRILDNNEVPYKVTRGGRHYKIYWGQHLREALIVPKTPSDYRSVYNVRAQVKRTLRQAGLLKETKQ
jgi:hypothetical protein